MVCRNSYVLIGVFDIYKNKIVYIDSYPIDWDDPDTYKNIDYYQFVLDIMHDSKNPYMEDYINNFDGHNYKIVIFKRYSDWEEELKDRTILCNMLLPMYNMHKIYYNKKGEMQIDWDPINFSEVYYKAE